MVFDTSGVHAVNLDYCDCPSDNKFDRRTQLLRQGWFPATFSRPNTVFTFDCLETFHEHTLQGKGNLYDFYHLLLRKTDNMNICDTIVSDCFILLISLEIIMLLSSIDTRRFTESSDSGGTSCPSNALAAVMTQRVSKTHRRVA
jgi:hypothetical protein